MLMIGEVARLAGTTVRAVRHYHATGLLPEPERDHSGYRRYGATALVRLLRIRRMRELGLPLDRIGDLLEGPKAALLDALDALDAELAAQAERIAAQRARLAQLRASNPDPSLPEPLARLFALAMADGAPPRVLQQDKEVLLLDLALHPEQTDGIVAEYAQVYDRLRSRPGYHELARRFDALSDAEADGPDTGGGEDVVDELAGVLADLLRSDALPTPVGARGAFAPEAERIFLDWVEALPPAQRRLLQRVAELAQDP
jgi:DNA-binding transcriptional MerR regulator